MIDLGEVHETAEINLNGKSVDTLIGTDYRLIFPAGILKKTNLLEIKVSNLMANRIAYLDKNGVNWTKFYNINMQTHHPENRRDDNVFTAKNWSPFLSGLIGPVVLIPLEYIK